MIAWTFLLGGLRCGKCSAPMHRGPPVTQRRGGRVGRNRKAGQGRVEEVQNMGTKEEESVRYIAARSGAVEVWSRP